MDQLPCGRGIVWFCFYNRLAVQELQGMASVAAASTFTLQFFVFSDSQLENGDIGIAGSCQRSCRVTSSSKFQ